MENSLHNQMMNIIQEQIEKRQHIIAKADWNHETKQARYSELLAFTYELDQALRTCKFEYGIYLKVVPPT